MNDITFSCPVCAQRIACDESGRGECINCPTCDSAITIPANGTPPPLPLVPAAVAQTASGDQGTDIELESQKQSKDWLLTIYPRGGEGHIYDKDQFVTALRAGILNGRFVNATKVEVHSKADDGKWSTSASTLGEFAKGHFQLRVLYEPVWSHALAGLKWGAVVGIGLKLLDTFLLFASANPTVGLMFLAVAGVCAIPRIGFAAVFGVSLLMSKFTDVNLFIPVLSATLVGAVLGCLPGMAIGGIIGVSRKHGLAQAGDAEPEPAGLALKTVAFPFAGAGAIWGLYLFVINPWLANAVAK